MLKSKLNLFFIIFLLNTPLAFSNETDIQEKKNLIENADIRNAFAHLDIGLGPFPIPLPSFGLGYRRQWNHHGADVYLNVATIVEATQVKGNALYHYYFTPNLKSQFYVGGGIGVSTIFLKHSVLCVSPEFVFGKEYATETGGRRFFQMQASFPTIGTRHFSGNAFTKSHVFYFPLVVFTYGVGF